MPARLKAVVVLCNPTRAVELLAGYAALRAGPSTSSYHSTTIRRLPTTTGR